MNQQMNERANKQTNEGQEWVKIRTLPLNSFVLMKITELSPHNRKVNEASELQAKLC